MKSVILLVLIALSTALSTNTAKAQSTHLPKRKQPYVEGKWVLSPRKQLVAFIRVPDKGEPELWVRHIKDGTSTLLRRGNMRIDLKDVRLVRIRWVGKLIRLQSPGSVNYIDMRGRLVQTPTQLARN